MSKPRHTSIILFINLKTTRPYILAMTRSSRATSTIRYQYNRFPRTLFATPRTMRKSVRPLSSYDIALVVDLADRCSLAALSNLRAWTSCRRYSSSSYSYHQHGYMRKGRWFTSSSALVSCFTAKALTRESTVPGPNSSSASSVSISVHCGNSSSTACLTSNESRHVTDLRNLVRPRLSRAR